MFRLTTCDAPQRYAHAEGALLYNTWAEMSLRHGMSQRKNLFRNVKTHGDSLDAEWQFVAMRNSR